MNLHGSILLAGGGALLLLLLGVQACAGPPRLNQPGLDPGQRAPDFAVADVNGKMIVLSELRGKPVVINFWSTSCPPCRIEMPEFKAVYEKYRDQAVFVGIAPSDTEAAVRDLISAHQYQWTFATDLAGKVAFPYEVYYYPTTYFIDSQGMITSVHQGGPLSRKYIETALQEAMRAR